MIKDDKTVKAGKVLSKAKKVVAEKAVSLSETSGVIKNTAAVKKTTELKSAAASLINKSDDFPVMRHRSLANDWQFQAKDSASTSELVPAGAKALSGNQVPLSSSLSSLSSVVSSITGLQFTLITPNLPADTFAVASFELEEAFSSPFLLNVELASHDANIDFGDVLDENVILTVWRDGIPERHLSGIVSGFEQGDTGFHRTRYSMEIRPALWRTTLRQNSRIFQQETIEQIIDTLMKENGRIDCAYSFRYPHPAREFCVQYQESDFDFIQRLTAEEGIFYYFEFEGGKHRVVFTDDASAQSDEIDLPYNPNRNAQIKEVCVSTLKLSEKVRPAQVKLKDYTFKNPVWPAEFSQQAKNADHQRTDYEHYDFPGRFKDEEHGEAFSRYRIEALRNDAWQGKGESNSFEMQPGVFFTISNHPRTDMNKQWQVVSIVHSGSQPQALEEEGGEQGTTLTNQFIFMPHNLTWRPTPLPKPKMDGPQIAMVVGPPTEEIYTDKYGRIRLRFLWDRYATGDDNSSCWIRVTQPWAGQGWGVIAIPRIGQEVVVDFLHGDPDQPIVTGRTYHANNLPSLGLPAAKTQMAFRSNTHKGSGYNELKFEDDAGKEELSMHAQKDMNTQVNNDRGTNVGNNHSENVGNNQSQSIGNNQDINVGTDQSVTIGNDQTISIGNDQTQTIGNDQTQIIANDQTEEVGNDQTLTVKNDRNVTVKNNHTETVQQNQTISVDQNQTVTVKQDQSTTIQGGQIVDITNSRSTTIKDSESLTVTNGIFIESTSGDITLQSSSGSASITLTAGGEVIIKGTDIQIEGSGQVAVLGATIQLNK